MWHHVSVRNASLLNVKRKQTPIRTIRKSGDAIAETAGTAKRAQTRTKIVTNAAKGDTYGHSVPSGDCSLLSGATLLFPQHPRFQMRNRALDKKLCTINQVILMRNNATVKNLISI